MRIMWSIDTTLTLKFWNPCYFIYKRGISLAFETTIHSPSLLSLILLPVAVHLMDFGTMSLVWSKLKKNTDGLELLPWDVQSSVSPAETGTSTQLPTQPSLASNSSTITHLSVPDTDYTTHFLINPKPGPDTLMWWPSPRPPLSPELNP